MKDQSVLIQPKQHVYGCGIYHLIKLNYTTCSIVYALSLSGIVNLFLVKLIIDINQVYLIHTLLKLMLKIVKWQDKNCYNIYNMLQ